MSQDNISLDEIEKADHSFSNNNTKQQLGDLLCQVV
jgi:hypothetical protein